ncbi:MAG TPA: hypothetical protein VFQ71_03575 [Gaiellales bacterium]|jgi:opacity protein-like surface antigen|nr:hypothetical protein [Gaiellales bacterium]
MRARSFAAGAVAAAGVAAALAAVALAATTGPPHLPSAPRCPVFPRTNVWNKRVDSLPVAPDSATMIDAIGAGVGLHPDFGSFRGYGIPYNVVKGSQRTVRVRFHYASESDRGPYPIPAHPAIEAGSDHHLLIVNRSSCRLYELYDARHTASGWTAGSGAIWNLRTNRLRPRGWTSADAAGLPILPGLVRYSEVRRGVINHALRFTVPDTCAGYIYPARHEAGSGSCSSLPPMGLRVRLRSGFDISRLAPQARPIAVALKRYGMIVADNGSPWYITGAANPHWNDDQLHTLDLITGSDLQVVDTRGFRNG